MEDHIIRKILSHKSILIPGLLGLIAVYGAIMATVSFRRVSRVGYVNTNVLLEKYRGFQNAREQLRKETDEAKKNVKTLETEINELGQEIISRGNDWDEQTRKSKQDAISRKQDEYARYGRAAAERAAKLEKELTQPVFHELNTQIARYGKENGYDVILGTVAGGNILYAQDSVDLTERFLTYISQK